MPGGRGQLVGDRLVGRDQHPPVAVALAAVVDDRLEARRPRSPRSPARAGRRARGCRSPRPPPGRPPPPPCAPASAAPRRRGRPAAAPPSPRATFEESMPALAQTKPWWVSQITRRPAPAHDPRALGEDQLAERRVLAGLLGERAGRRRPGAPRASTTIRPSALLTTFWATITTSPGTTPSAPARGGEHPGEVVRRAHLGQGRQRPEPQRALPASSARRSRARAGRPSVAPVPPSAIRARPGRAGCRCRGPGAAAAR